MQVIVSRNSITDTAGEPPDPFVQCLQWLGPNIGSSNGHGNSL